MSRFIVFEPPVSPGTAPAEASAGPSDRARFLRDGFAGWAVLFPFFWLFRHGLVLSGIAAFVLWLGFGLLSEVPGLRLAGAVLPILLGVAVALEGPSLKAAKFRRKRFRETAVIEAANEEEAAILYYAGAESIQALQEVAVPPPFAGRPSGPARTLLDLPRPDLSRPDLSWKAS